MTTSCCCPLQFNSSATQQKGKIPWYLSTSFKKKPRDKIMWETKVGQVGCCQKIAFRRLLFHRRSQWLASINGKHTKRSNGGKLHAPKRQYHVTKDTFSGMTSHTFITTEPSLRMNVHRITVLIVYVWGHMMCMFNLDTMTVTSCLSLCSDVQYMTYLCCWGLRLPSYCVSAPKFF